MNRTNIMLYRKNTQILSAPLAFVVAKCAHSFLPIRQKVHSLLCSSSSPKALLFGNSCRPRASVARGYKICSDINSIRNLRYILLMRYAYGAICLLRKRNFNKISNLLVEANIARLPNFAHIPTDNRWLPLRCCSWFSGRGRRPRRPKKLYKNKNENVSVKLVISRRKMATKIFIKNLYENYCQFLPIMVRCRRNLQGGS